MRFNNLSINIRLASAFSVLVLIIVSIVALSLTRLSDVNHSMEKVVNDHYRKIAVINNISGKTGDFAISLRNKLFMHDPAQIAAEQAVMDSLSADNTRLFNELYALITEPQSKASLDKVTETRKGYAALRKQIDQLFASGDREAAETLMLKEMVPLQKTYFSQLDDLADIQKTQMDESVAKARQVYDTTTLIMLAAGAAAAVFAALVAWTISRSITVPLHRAVEVAETVAAGNLTTVITAHSSDETGRLLQALGTMNQKLKTIVQEVRRGTDSIVTASSEIASGNLDLSSRTEAQASALEQTASSMEQLTSSVRQNAEHTRKSSELAGNATRIAREGGVTVTQVVQTMNAINESSRKIVDIISVIDGIAFQTNILALNAAVEAARAGEQGRGFAVVASEVRVLAQRSASAAKEIKALINDSVSQVSAGTELVAQAGHTMERVVGSIGEVSHVVSEITAATREQSDGIEQVNQAVLAMDTTTQQNAALVEQAAAAQALQSQSQQLLELVSVFRLDEQPLAPPAQAARAAATPTAHAATPMQASAITRKAMPKVAPASKLSHTPETPAALPAARRVESDADEWTTF